jgi:hypothetical protein
MPSEKTYTVDEKCLAKTMGGEFAPQYNKISTGWSYILCAVYSNNPYTINGLKITITEYIQNVDCAVLKTVFENTVRHVNKCLETGGGTL